MKEHPRALMILIISSVLGTVLGDHYDVRCKCVCPNAGIINATSQEAETRRIYIKNVPPK